MTPTSCIPTTGEILDEMLSALRKNRPDISEDKGDRLRERMNAAVRDCLVTEYQSLIEILDLPDPRTSRKRN